MGCESLFPYYHFGVAQHFVVQCIPRLHTIQNLTFLCFRRCGDYRDGFMEISIQRLVFRLDDFHTILSQNSHKFVVNQFHPFFYGIDIRCRFHRLDGTFEIVHYRKNTAKTLFATIQDQFGLLL